MSKQDLKLFLDKVDQLRKMVDSLEHSPGRRDALEACEDHNQVVQLARSWGYEIGRRWGDVVNEDPVLNVENLFGRSLPSAGLEERHLLQAGSNWRIELILSCAAKSKEGFWYDQNENEWIAVLRGSARLRLKDPDCFVDLGVGDYMHLDSNRLHRVERTDPYPGTIWLAIFWD